MNTGSAGSQASEGCGEVGFEHRVCREPSVRRLWGGRMNTGSAGSQVSEGCGGVGSEHRVCRGAKCQKVVGR